MQPKLNVAVTGSSAWLVPGTREACGTIVPGTTGPRSFVHSGKSSALSAQPIASHMHRRDASIAGAPGVKSATYSAMSTRTWSGAGRTFESEVIRAASLRRAEIVACAHERTTDMAQSDNPSITLMNPLAARL